MKNIMMIFLGDLKKIWRNVIAWIVILGITIIPSMYAWFNIAASWDPYGNTGNLKVAVASTDEGYKGELFPMELNLGDTVISSLRENKQLEWVFTDEKTAIKGVKKGSYYAAIVLPESFSRDMMSLFSSNVQHSDIIYYLNEKQNAIAPKVTGKGAGAVQKQIDEVFTKTLTQVGFSVMQGISGNMDEVSMTNFMGNFTENLQTIETDLNTAASTMRAFANMTGSLQKMLDTTSAFLKQTGSYTDGNKKNLKEAGTDISSFSETLNKTTDTISEMLSQTGNCYKSVSDAVDDTFSHVASDTEVVSSNLADLSEKTNDIINKFSGFRDTLLQLENALPNNEKLLRSRLNSLLVKTNASITRQEAVRDKLSEAAKNTDDTITNAKKYQKEIKKMAAQSSTDIKNLKNDYETNVQQKMKDLSGTLNGMVTPVSGLLDKLDDSAQAVGTLAVSSSSDIAKLNEVLQLSASLLEKSAKKIDKVIRRVQKAVQTKDLSTLESILKSDSDVISGFLAAPVSLNTVKKYPVKNYGSAMAPFYSALSIWVGGIVLVALLKVNLSEKRKAKFLYLKNYQMYLGRYILFLILGLMQSGLICLGDLFFLQIQCEHPFYFLLAGWITSIVFVNIIYTLTVSFGDIGKAICVVLLVMQVAGSGGTFPIEMTPSFFQKVYPLLPFTHSMNAMRECIAGFYNNTYWKELGILMIFLGLSLLLGLGLRTPIIHLNELFTEKLEDTKLM